MDNEKQQMFEPQMLTLEEIEILMYIRRLTEEQRNALLTLLRGGI